jgi:alpha-methylacyl-CoA racemase
MLDGLVGLQQAQFALHAIAAPADTILTGGLPSYNLYACRDGWVSVGALEPQFHAALAAGTGHSDPEGLAAWFATRSRAEAAAALPEACVVPVLSLAEVLTDPQVAARDLFRDGLPQPPTGPVAGRVPRLGEHNAEELG